MSSWPDRGRAGRMRSSPDWDFAVTTSDFAAVARDLPALVAPLHPLGQQWEPLGHFPVYQVLLPGPTKVEYLFLDQSQQPMPVPKPGPATLDAINTHFWDWIWWVATKAAIGRNDLVAEHLPQLFGRLLRPIGVPEPPATSGARSTRSSADATNSSGITPSPSRERSKRKCAQASAASASPHSEPRTFRRFRSGVASTARREPVRAEPRAAASRHNERRRRTAASRVLPGDCESGDRERQRSEAGSERPRVPMQDAGTGPAGGAAAPRGMKLLFEGPGGVRRRA